LEVLAESEEIGLEKIASRLHRDFQRLWLVPPHERSREQEAQWEEISKLVDVDEYLRKNAREELVIGKIESIDGDCVRLTLLTDEPEQQIISDLRNLPAAAAGMEAGQYFEAMVVRGENRETDWKRWTIRPPLREDDAVWDDFDRLTQPAPTGSE
jgi:hypothetical protein